MNADTMDLTPLLVLVARRCVHIPAAETSAAGTPVTREPDRALAERTP